MTTSKTLMVMALAMACGWPATARGADEREPTKTAAAPRADGAATVDWIGQPLIFQPNVGQDADKDVAFSASAGPLRLELRAGGIDARLGAGDDARVRLSVRDGRAVAPTGVSPTSHVLNYYASNDPASWVERAATYGAVRYPGVLPRIDMVVHGNAGALEYDFEVQPGGDPSRITVDMTGQRSMTLAANGDLRVETTAGTIVQRHPVAYQVIDGVRRPVPARFVLDGHSVRFALGAWDRSRALVIDPEISFATYLGGAGSDLISSMVATPAGDVYVAWRSDALACVSKFSFAPAVHAGYTTCLGTQSASVSNSPGGIRAQADGSVVVTGTTDDPTFPTTAGAYDKTCSCDGSYGDQHDGFVLKLDPGGALVASTFLGTEDEIEQLRGVATDPVTGEIVATGWIHGATLPIVGGPSTVRINTVGRSSDGLTTWSPRGFRREFRGLAVSPVDPDVLLGITELELLQSSDGGITWTERHRLRYGQSRFPFFRSVVFSPDGATAYTATQNDVGLLRSTDAGVTWTSGTLPTGPQGSVYQIGTSPANAALVFVCDENGLQRSIDRGATFTKVRNGCGPFTSTPGGLLYVGGGAPARSTDGGVTWTSIAAPEGRAIEAIAVNPANADELLASFDVPGTGTTGTAAHARSVDGGQTWTRLATLTRANGYRDFDLAFDPTTPGRAYASTSLAPPGSNTLLTDPTTTWRIDAGVVTPHPEGLRHLVFAPGAPGIAYRAPWNNGSDVYVARFTPDLKAITWSGLLSSSGIDQPSWLDVQPDGQIVVGGFYGQVDGPATHSLGATTRYRGTTFVARLDPRLAGEESLADVAVLPGLSIAGMAVEAGGDVVVTGSTRPGAPAFPAEWTANGVQKTPAGGTDAVMLRLTANLRQVTGGTYLGGPGNDFGSRVGVDAQGSYYMRVQLPNGQALDALPAVRVSTVGEPGSPSGSPYPQAYLRLRPTFDVVEDVVHFDDFDGRVGPAGQTGALYIGVVREPQHAVENTARPLGTIQATPGGGNDVFLMRIDFGALAPRLTMLGPAAGSASGGTVLRARLDGASGTPTATVGGVAAVVTRDGTRYRITTPALPAGTPLDVAVTVDGQTVTAAGAFLPLADAALAGDADGDGLSDAWEARYSLDPTRNDAQEDADGDGVTNADELAAGTHPAATFARYLAEGAQSDFFSHRLALLNPGEAPVTAVVRSFTGTGTIVTKEVLVQGRRRLTVEAAAQPALVGQEFSSEVEAALPLVVERTMTWNATRYGSHSETATIMPATQWYFAEGATLGPFDLFYLLQNPGTDPATVTGTYLLGDGTVLEKTYTVPARSRFNIWADVEQFDTGGTPAPLLASAEFSAVFEVTAGPKIIAERAMYLSNAAQFAAGHQTAGNTAPATRWFLAEGATGAFFDLFVLVGNPGTTPADLSVTYLLPDGTSRVKAYTVRPRSRFNIWVDEEQFPEGSGDTALADTAVSVIVESTNGTPVIVERAMWWPGPTSATWAEAHNSVANRGTAARWGVADAEVGAGWAAGDCGTADDCDETYVLVANTGAVAGTVRATVLFEDAAPEARDFAVAANSRLNISLRDEFPATIGKRVGMVVESVGAALPLVVERATYGNAGGVKWAAGANAPGTPLP